jgi:DNA-binding NtrC family response regulator
VGGFLIVEDEPLVARAIARALPPGEGIVIVHDVSAAERYISTSTSWKAFIIDIVLGNGGKSGFDVLTTALTRHPETPALVVTGHDHPGLDARARALGADFMRKPFTSTDIRRFADRACSKKGPPLSSPVISTRDVRRRGRVVIADDDPSLTPSLCRVLEREGFDVTSVTTTALEEEVRKLDSGAVILANLSLRAIAGHDDTVLRLSEARKDLRFVVGARSFGLIGAIMRAADASWLEETPELEDLRARLLGVLGYEDMRAEREAAAAPARAGAIGSPVMSQVHELADKIARSARAPALLVGESGVGKEVIATRIHERSLRRTGPFVRLNLAAISDGMLEAELFGSVRGAFTDAKRDRPGLVASADGGTLLLDEIGECRVEIQVKLLRVIENRTFFPVGSDKERTVDVRIIAATNRPPMDVNNGGTLRTDLLFRLGTVILIPPLRERREEILPLAEQFAREVCAENGLRAVRFTRAARSALESHEWPGNVRELKHVVERAVMLAESSDLDAEVLDLRTRSAPAPVSSRDKGLADARASAERIEIISALDAAGGSPTAAARKLGISRSTLYEKLKKHNLR